MRPINHELQFARRRFFNYPPSAILVRPAREEFGFSILKERSWKNNAKGRNSNCAQTANEKTLFVTNESNVIRIKLRD